MKAVGDAQQQEALVGLEAAIAELFDAGLEPKDARDAARFVARLESIGHRVDAAKTQLYGEIDEKMLHARDGYFSARVMVRHKGRLSGAEAAARAGAHKALARMDHLRIAYELGQIGTAQVRRLARLYANPRVREALIRDEDEFIRLAGRRSYKEFDLEVTDWERMVDQDGTADKAAACHRNRDVRIVQEFDLGFQMSGRFGSFQGALVEEILRHFNETELKADFDEARERLGPDVVITKDMLCRTDAQRRADALTKALLAGATNPGDGGTASFVTNLVLDHDTFERETARAAGEAVPDENPWRPNFQSRTINGRLIDTAEATAAALLFDFRRVVVDGKGITIDLGRQRKFVGGCRLAVQLMDCTCTFAGCEVPMTDCDIDHLLQWSERSDGGGGGLTNPGNGAGMCPKHNRFKYLSGYTTYRDEDGRWHTLRPDGTEV